MKKFLVVFLFLLSWSAYALNNVDKQDILYKNYYGSNSGFEQGLKDVTVSSALKALESTIVRTGNRALKCTLDAANDYCELKVAAIPGADQNALAEVWYRTTSATIKMSVFDSSGNEINNITYLPANTGYQPARVSYTAVSGTTYKIRFTQSAASTDIIYVDDVWQGVNPLINNLSQAVLYGSIKYAGTTNCTWTNTTTGSWQSFAADTDCPTASVIGKASAPGTKIPGIVLSSMPKGDYLIVASGLFYVNDNSATAYGFLRFSDGTNTTSGTMVYGSGTGTTDFTASVNSVIGRISLSADQGSTTIQVQSNIAAGIAGAYIGNDSAERDFEIQVYYFPSTPQQAIQSEQANKFGSATWLNVSNCIFTNTGGIMTDADCNTGTVIPSGSITSGDDNLQLTAANLKAGSVYKITAVGQFSAEYASSATGCNFQIYDGSTYSGSIRSYAADATSSVDYNGTLIGYFSYTSFQASKTFSVYADRTPGGGSCNCYANSAGLGCSIAIEEVYPNAAQPQMLELVPAGTMLEYTGTTAPTGYLLADGTSYLKASYPKLYAVIGDKYGTADSTHFNVPDMRGRFARGYVASATPGVTNDPDAASRTACATGGSTGATLGSCQADVFQGHYHSSSFVNGASGGSNQLAVEGITSSASIQTDYGDWKVLAPKTDGVNGTPRTSSQTYPYNVSFNYIIKY